MHAISQRLFKKRLERRDGELGLRGLTILHMSLCTIGFFFTINIYLQMRK